MHIAEFRTADGVPFMNHTGQLWELRKTTGGHEVVRHDQWQLNLHACADGVGFSSACYIYAGNSSKQQESMFSTKSAAHQAAADLAMEEAKSHMHASTQR